MSENLNIPYDPLADENKINPDELPEHLRNKVEALQELAHLLAKDPKMRIAVLRKAGLSTKGRPQGTYYKASFAEQLIPFLRKMIESKKDVKFYTSNYPGINPQTLYYRIMQSMLYLTREYGPTNEWIEFRKQVEIMRESDGTAIRWKSNITDKYMPLVGAMLDTSATAEENWRTKLELFIANSAKGDKLAIEHLNLNDEEIVDIQAMLADLPNFAGKVSHNTVSMVRLE